MKTYFVSGHLDLTAEEFAEHYVPGLEIVMGNPCAFVVGDARGCDAMAQAWLASRKANVVVFHMFEQPRNCVGGFPKRGGFTTDTERDEAMTRESTFDVAWIRPGRWNSGTARNLARRIYNWVGGEFYCESGTETCSLSSPGTTWKSHACALHQAVMYNELFAGPRGP